MGSRLTERLFIRQEETSGISPNLPLMIKLMNLRLGYAKDGPSQSLVEVITKSRNSNAKEGQDKVFALLGLSKDFETFPLRPDYSADIREVFGNVVEHALKNGQFLSFCMSGLASRAKGQLSTPSTMIPSWMPELINPLFMDTNRYHKRGYTAGIGTQDTRALYKISLQWDVLKLQGVYIDTIITRSSNSQLSGFEFVRLLDSTETGFEDILRLIEARSLFEHYVPSEDLDNVEQQAEFWSTVSDDFDGKVFEDHEHFLQVLDSLEDNLALIITMLEDASLLPNDTSETKQNPKYQSETLAESLAKLAGIPLSKPVFENLMPMDFRHLPTEITLQSAMFMSIHSVMTGAFAVTKNKRVALVPQEAQVNDIIVVPDGSPVPHVLRPLDASNSSYLFVGEVFVHGCMHGEAMKNERVWFSLH